MPKSVERCRHRGGYHALRSNHVGLSFLWCVLCGAYRQFIEKESVISPVKNSKWTYPKNVTWKMNAKLKKLQ